MPASDQDPPQVLDPFAGFRTPEKVEQPLRDSRNQPSVVQNLAVAVVGAALFGLWTGLYTMSLPQLIASGLKAPMLLVGTAAICFPTFFGVQQVLAPKPLGWRATLLLQSGALAVIGGTWAVVALPCSLYLANAQNYGVAKLFVGFVGAFGGVVGMLWFVRSYRAASAVSERPGSALFAVLYGVLFAFVGAQLAWNLRPFLGSPSQGFSLFRPAGGNLIENLLSP